MYGLVYSSFMDYARREGFASSGSDAGAMILALLLVIAVVIVQLFVVRWLWNNVLTRCVTVVKPIPDLWYTLGLLVTIALIHPGYVSASA